MVDALKRYPKVGFGSHKQLDPVLYGKNRTAVEAFVQRDEADDFHTLGQAFWVTQERRTHTPLGLLGKRKYKIETLLPSETITITGWSDKGAVRRGIREAVLHPEIKTAFANKIREKLSDHYQRGLPTRTRASFKRRPR